MSNPFFFRFKSNNISVATVSLFTSHFVNKTNRCPEKGDLGTAIIERRQRHYLTNRQIRLINAHHTKGRRRPLLEKRKPSKKWHRQRTISSPPSEKIKISLFTPMTAVQMDGKSPMHSKNWDWTMKVTF
jgi:hypothetical protein